MCVKSDTFFHNHLDKRVNTSEHVKPFPLPVPSRNRSDIHSLLSIFMVTPIQVSFPGVYNSLPTGFLATSLSSHPSKLPASHQSRLPKMQN